MGIRERAVLLRREVAALALALGHPRTPRSARLVIVLVVAYAVSPIDLIPDVIPVLGLLDDLVLVPLGVSLAIRMIPADVLEECRNEQHGGDSSSLRRAGIMLVLGAWLVLGASMVLIVRRLV